MQTGAQTGPARARRRHFFDVRAGVRSRESGAVRMRELMVWAAYIPASHARTVARQLPRA